MKKEVIGLQDALDELLALKRKIRFQLQEEIKRIKILFEELVENQRKLRRLEEYEREQK